MCSRQEYLDAKAEAEQVMADRADLRKRLLTKGCAAAKKQLDKGKSRAKAKH